MKTARSSTELMNLDVLALSLLCCLLASVVGVLVLGGEAAAQVPVESKPDNQEIWTSLHEQSTKLFVRVQEVERSRDAIVDKLNHSLLERENLVLESRVTEIQAKFELLNKIRTAKSEIARLLKDFEDEEKTNNAALTPEARRILGEYKGPYVLIECVEDAAVVYPGRQRIEMKPSNVQTDQLLHQITNAGFVAFVVRPDGWYDNSFDNLRKVIYEKLDKIEKDTGKYVGRSTFPLTSTDPITNYFPPEAKQ
jgi:hypothetical protein